MSDKYKLKLWYPSLPKWFRTDMVVTFKPTCPEGPGDNVYQYNYKGHNVILDAEEVENNPEFWEKIEEKDYEILKVQTTSRHPDHFKGTVNSHIFNFDVGNIEYMFKKHPKWWKIYSVHRLSDDEVFTVGDTIKGHSGENFKIKGIRVSEHDGKLLIHAAKGSRSFNKHLDRVEHVKEPLFITEDGFDMYEKDRYWGVTSSLYLKPSIATDPPQEYRAKFATREKAEKYVERYRVRYSKADIKEALAKALGSNSGDLSDVTFKPYKFKELLDL